LIQFVTESIANKLGESALEFGKREHYPLFKHIGDTCDMTIITSGIPLSTNIDVFEKKESREVYNKRPFISFACTSHEDKCDRLSNKCKDHFINNFKDSVYKLVRPYLRIVGYGHNLVNFQFFFLKKWGMTSACSNKTTSQFFSFFLSY